MEIDLMCETNLCTCISDSYGILAEEQVSVIKKMDLMIIHLTNLVLKTIKKLFQWQKNAG